MKISSIPVKIYINSKPLPFENTSYKNKTFFFSYQKASLFHKKSKGIYVNIYIYIYIYLIYIFKFTTFLKTGVYIFVFTIVTSV